MSIHSGEGSRACTRARGSVILVAMNVAVSCGLVVVALGWSACGEVALIPPDAVVPDVVVVDPCASCDVNATCPIDSCECNAGFTGDGTTCADVDECATANGGCADIATCTNTPGGRTCTCPRLYAGDGVTCALRAADVTRAGCAVPEAEHPGYTNIAGDVVLCGSRYTPATIASACAASFHVCEKTEWFARYPIDRPYKTAPADPDLIGPTLGTLSSWGVAQSTRCAGGVWQDSQPDAASPYPGSVCHYGDDLPTNADGADYLPTNNGKFLLDDDGTTVLQGKNAAGALDCCSWDVSFEPSLATNGLAVYCCAD